jgi:hemerythrin
MLGYFIWDIKYSVQIPWVDGQHKKIISAINRLAEAMEDGRTGQMIAGILEDLADYSRTHFSAEEAMLVRYGYPALTEHRQQHEAYIVKIQEFKNRLRGGEEQLSLKILDFLKQWLSAHILVEDMKYIAFLQSRGVILETVSA